MQSLLIGAGFSKWTSNIPVANQLFDFRIEPYGARESKKFNFVKAIKDEWDVENPQGFNERFISSALNMTEKSDWQYFGT